MKLKLKRYHPYRLRMHMRQRVRILREVDDEYGTNVSSSNLKNAESALKLALQQRWC